MQPIAQRDSAAYFDNRIALLLGQNVGRLPLAPAVAEIPKAWQSATIGTANDSIAPRKTEPGIDTALEEPIPFQEGSARPSRFR
jgi:hypothetical protein